MCNAKSLHRTRDEIERFVRRIGLALIGEMPPFEPRYRVAPRQRHLIFRPVADADGEPPTVRADLALWDLIPPGDAKPFLRTNARAEGLTTTWPWKLFVRANRCLVPSDGFFEPEKPGRGKGSAPWYYYTMRDGEPFLLAGLYSDTADPQTGEVTTSYTIITTEANAAIRVHDRMPAIIAAEDAAEWLFADAFPGHLLGPYPAERMTGWRVTDEAKNPRRADHPGMIAPIDTQASLF